MITKDEILLFLKNHKNELYIDYQITKIGLFGSFAVNQENEYSDIDLIVEFQPETLNLSEKKAKLKELLNRKFNREIDICREKYIKPYFKNQILKTAIYVW